MAAADARACENRPCRALVGVKIDKLHKTDRVSGGFDVDLVTGGGARKRRKTALAGRLLCIIVLYEVKRAVVQFRKILLIYSFSLHSECPRNSQ